MIIDAHDEHEKFLTGFEKIDFKHQVQYMRGIFLFLSYNKHFLPKNHQIRTGASPGTFSTVSGTARMVPAEAPKMLISSTQSVPVDKTLKAALLSILNNVEGNSAKSNVLVPQKAESNRCRILDFSKAFRVMWIQS